ncbi:MAG: hypothetical protein AAGJ40_16995 [Planctomycetota bacterium]
MSKRFGQSRCPLVDCLASKSMRSDLHNRRGSDAARPHFRQTYFADSICWPNKGNAWDSVRLSHLQIAFLGNFIDFRVTML